MQSTKKWFGKAVTQALICGFAVLSPSVATADFIDFETQGAGALSTFPMATNGVPLTIGIATFTGGGLLDAESGFSADLSAVYATSNMFPASNQASFANPITITFSSPVTNFSVLVTNVIDDNYTLTDNLGTSVTNHVPFSSIAQNLTFSLPDTGITSVTIQSQLTNTSYPGVYDFAIDNVSFSQDPPAAPEPASLTLLGIGAVSLVGYAWKRRKQPLTM